MPVSVGEVNATLRIIVLQDQLAVAKQNLREVMAEFLELGTMTPSQLKNVRDSVFEAGAAVVGLQNQVKALNAELRQTGPAIASGGAGAGAGGADQAAAFSTLDLLATRMIQRMLIFQAIRGSEKLIEDIFQSANAMIQLSEKTDLSISTLRAFEQAGLSIGISTDSTSKAVEALNKNLVTMKGDTLEGIVQLGLSFDKIFAMGPEERFNAVMLALEGVTDKVVRQKLEYMLLGTDGLDPLISKYAELMDASKDAGISPESTKVLAQVYATYKVLFELIEEKGAAFIGFGINSFDKVFSPLFAFFNSGSITERIEAFAEALHRTIVPDPERTFVGPIFQPDQMAAGEKALEELESRFKTIQEMDPITKDKLDRLRDIDLLTEHYAKTVGVTAEEFRQYTKETQDHTSALLKHDEALIKEFRDEERLLQLILRDNEVRRAADVQLIELAATRSAMTDKELETQKLLDKTASIKADIADIQRLKEIEYESYQNKLKIMETDEKAKALTEDYNRVVQQLATRQIRDEEELIKLKLKEAEIVRQIREENAAAFGLTTAGITADKNLTPMDLAERHFEAALDAAATRLREGLITQDDYNEIVKAATRTFNEEIDAATGVTKANKDLVSSAQPLIQANKMAAAAAEEFVRSMEISGGFHLPKFSLDRPFVDPGSLLNPVPTFDTGGMVTRSGLAIVHQGELVKAATKGSAYDSSGSINVTLNVQGVWDPATVRTMANMVGSAILSGSNRQLPTR